MHAYIITGGSADKRSNHINELLGKRAISPHDVITIVPEPISIGVDSVRSVAVHLSLHPVASDCHAVVVRNAHAMTLEAQNAFLKTLEEPPGNALIILETNQPEVLLPTILSRCHIIRLSDRARPCQSDAETLSQCLQTIQHLRESSAGERLRTIDAIAKTREEALAFVNLSIQSLAHHLRMTGRGPVNPDISTKLPPATTAKLLRSLLTARTQIMGNITPKLALDNIFHSLS